MGRPREYSSSRKFPQTGIVSAALERQIAVAANADPRTVRRWLAGWKTHSAVGERIRVAVEKVLQPGMVLS